MGVNIQMAITELHKAFYSFNRDFFNNELPEPAILIQHKGNRKNVLGWCSTKEIWKNDNTKELKYEINIVAEYLNRHVFEVMATLLHEMVHLWNITHKIQDVSRSGTYHNKRFKEEAEKRGLIVDKDDRLGWCMEKLTPAMIEYIKKLKLNDMVFSMARNSKYRPEKPDDEEGGEEGGGDGEEGKTKSSVRKYVCPKCDTIIRATKDVDVICGNCNVHFVKEEK